MHRSLFFYLAAVVLFGQLTGCSLFAERVPVVDLPEGIQFRLLPSSILSSDIAATQKVTGSYGDRPFVLLSHIEIDNEHFAMVATTTAGNTLFALDFSTDDLTVSSSPWLPKNIDALHVLADFQLIFWPKDTIAQNLQSDDIQIIDNASARTRKINHNGSTIIEIKYQHDDPWQSTIEFKNHVWGYTYIIETLELERQNSLPN